jgi:oligopeptide/dipeptide ABC transporter ATP-binding protein
MSETVNELLTVDGLSVSYGSHRVLNDVALRAGRGEIVGVIGETGSGKTTLARAIAGLVGAESGRIRLDGVELSRLKGRARREHRRSGAVHYVFQDPLRSLDPDLRVGEIVREPLAIAGRLSRAEQQDRVIGALHRVGLPAELIDRVPGDISGGQRQRVSIARAIVGRPQLLICDEPVSALDASNRNHVLRLLDELRRGDRATAPAILLISHDLSSLAGIADRVVVLYRGRVVEEGPIAQVFNDPWHPYTALLIASAPSVRREHRLLPAQLRTVGAGSQWPAQACVFADRCRFADSTCGSQPALLQGGDRAVACHHLDTWRESISAGPAEAEPEPEPAGLAGYAPAGHISGRAAS